MEVETTPAGTRPRKRERGRGGLKPQSREAARAKSVPRKRASDGSVQYYYKNIK
jgi:hypothetical protein